MIGSKRILNIARVSGLLAVAFCGVTAAAAEEPTLAWKRQPGSETLDVADGLATDAAGDVYMTGITTGSLGGAFKGGTFDSWVRKYEPSGRLLWQRQPGTKRDDIPRGVATDAAGNVYLTGSTEGSLAGDNKGLSDVWVRKYDSSGRLLWQRQPGTRMSESARGVATDAAGNVYLAGSTSGSLGGAKHGDREDTDAWVAKYDTTGRSLWQRQPGTDKGDVAQDVATDAAGNVYIAGTTRGSLAGDNKGLSDVWLAKYDPSGHLLWQLQPGSRRGDGAVGVAADAAGNVYLAGYTDGSLGGPNKGRADAWVAKYDSSGRLLWQRQSGTDRDDFAIDVATDADGNAYFVGYTEGSLNGTNEGRSDAWVSKHDSFGRLLWQRQLGTSGFDRARAVATDAAGDVYLAGETSESLGGANKGDYDAWLMKFSPADDGSGAAEAD